jgi:prophage regulatory protein
MMIPKSHLDSPRFLRLAEVRNRVGYGRASIYRLMAAGEFPRSYSLGARAVAWLESEIETWIESRVRGGGTASPAVRLEVR